MLVTIYNNADQTFWIFYFLCVFGFVTQKQVKIDKKKKKCKNTSKQIANKQNNFQHLLERQHKAHNQSMSQNIGSINAWTCCNAYACVPFFTYMTLVFRVISLEDWVLLL